MRHQIKDLRSVLDSYVEFLVGEYWSGLKDDAEFFEKKDLAWDKVEEVLGSLLIDPPPTHHDGMTLRYFELKFGLKDGQKLLIWYNRWHEVTFQGKTEDGKYKLRMFPHSSASFFPGDTWCSEVKEADDEPTR